MKKFCLKSLKKIPRRLWIKLILVIFVSLILAIGILYLLNYLSYFFHELGHANSAVLYTFMKKEPMININFTYVDYSIPYLNLTLKVPQQTITKIPRFMLFYGVLFTFILYGFIILILSKIKRVKESKRLESSITFVFLLLILRDIIFNLFCGTDGFNLSCNKLFVDLSGYIFNIFLLISLGYFFTEIILFKVINPQTPKNL